MWWEILLREKSPSVSAEYVNGLCDDVIELLKRWNAFFSLLQKKNPTDDQKKEARAVADRAVQKHR